MHLGIRIIRIWIMESTYMNAPSNKHRSVFEEKKAITSKCDFENACI